MLAQQGVLCRSIGQGGGVAARRKSTGSETGRTLGERVGKKRIPRHKNTFCGEERITLLSAFISATDNL